jgi:hypothetical protein
MRKTLVLAMQGWFSMSIVDLIWDGHCTDERSIAVAPGAVSPTIGGEADHE